MTFAPHVDADTLAAAVAAELAALIDAALRERGRALLALAGGRTPLPAYRLLAAQARDWSRVSLVPTDERWVAHGHPARNEDALREAFAAARGVHVVPLVPTHPAATPDATFARAQLATLDAPFDAVLLGMGGDGHVASLFPHSPGLDAAIDPQSSEAAFVVVPDPLPAEAPHARITLGLARLLRSRRRLLVVGGDAKREVMDAALAAPPSPTLPVGLVLHASPGAMQIHWSP